MPEKAEQAAKRKTERKPLRFPYMVEDKMKKMKNCYLHSYNTQNLFHKKHRFCYKNVKWSSSSLFFLKSIGS